MIRGNTIVVDIGKTNAKISLWDAKGDLLERSVRSNQPQNSASGYRALDVRGIDAWMVESLATFGRLGPAARIVTVGHGAAAALLLGGALFTDPMDYEQEIGPAEREAYDAQRDPFGVTGSPALPAGLNLGVQLHFLETLLGPLPEDVIIVPWPQYWAWRLSGVAASEVTSLGCHSDLWRPGESSFSELAVQRGWASRMAPLRHAGDSLGPITAELAAATGLNRDCQVLCGLHDSNAALLAARGHAEIADHETTVLSTGTWFVAMRSVAAGTDVGIGTLQEARDCLVNVDVNASPTPSARFMGGREAELLCGADTLRQTDACEPDELLACLPALIRRGTGATPGFVPGVGPFPDAAGSWRDKPDDPLELRAGTDLYLALVANTALDLIGSRDRLLVDGLFAQDAVFTTVLAALRPDQAVFTSNAEHDIAYGALRLIAPDLPPPCELKKVDALDLDIGAYAAAWQERAQQAQEAA